MTSGNNCKQKATGHVTSLANGHFTGSDAPFVCEIPTASSNIKRYNFADIGLTLLQRRHVSSVRVGLANGTKRTPSQNCSRFLLSELHVPHKQCLTGISNAAFSAVSGHLSRGFSVPPTKRTYSALHPQALTECSPLDFRRSSISARKTSHEHNKDPSRLRQFSPG